MTGRLGDPSTRGAPGSRGRPRRKSRRAVRFCLGAPRQEHPPVGQGSKPPAQVTDRLCPSNADASLGAATAETDPVDRPAARRRGARHPPLTRATTTLISVEWEPRHGRTPRPNPAVAGPGIIAKSPTYANPPQVGRPLKRRGISAPVERVAILDVDAGAIWCHDGSEGSITEYQKGVPGWEEEPGGGSGGRRGIRGRRLCPLWVPVRDHADVLIGIARAVGL